MDRVFIDEHRSGDDREITQQLKEKFNVVPERRVNLKF